MVKVEFRLSLNAELVNPNTQYEIIEEPNYLEFKREDKTVKKLVVPLRDVNSGTEYNFYPNKSNLKKLVAKLGQETANWVGHYLQFELVKVKYMGKEVNSISIKEVQ